MLYYYCLLRLLASYKVCNFIVYVYYGYLSWIFVDFLGFLSMVIQVMLFYVHNVKV